MSEKEVTDAVDALRILLTRNGLTITAAAKKADMPPKHLYNAMDRPDRQSSQAVFEQVAVKALKMGSVADMIAKANGVAEVDMARLAQDIDYLCAQHIGKTQLAKSLSINISDFYKILGEKKIPARMLHKLPEALGVQSIDDVHMLAEGYRKQEFPKADICVAARKIRAERGRTEGLLKEDMHDLLRCSRSEYALVEKGDPVVSMLILNKLPQAHGYADMHAMMKAAEILPEPEHRARPSRSAPFKSDRKIPSAGVKPGPESWVSLVGQSRGKKLERE